MAGKGDKPRPTDLKKFGKNYDEIDWHLVRGHKKYGFMLDDYDLFPKKRKKMVFIEPQNILTISEG